MQHGNIKQYRVSCDVSTNNLEYGLGKGELAGSCNDAGVRARAIGAAEQFKGGLGSAAREVAMRWKEVMPGESFDERRFGSEPFGLWEGGISRPEFGRYRVGLSRVGSGLYALSYWGGDLEEAQLLCGFVLGMSWWLEEEITEEALARVFPVQADKELDAQFYAALFLARDRLVKGAFER
jgi:hypothetical protein